MWIQAVDGRFYCDPVFMFKDVFFRCEDDRSELVSRSQLGPVKAKAAAIKESSSLKLKLGKREPDDVMWPDASGVDLCHIWQATPLEQIPVPVCFRFVINEPCYDDRIVGFRSEFDTNSVIDTLHGVEQDTGLIKALFGRDHYKLDMEKMKGQLAKELFRQHPWLGAVTKSNKARVLNTQPARIKITWKQCS